MGAAFLAIIEYTVPGTWMQGPIGYSKFYVEGKIQGGAGVNIDASISPKSGTFSKQLFSAAASYDYVTLGSGFKLGFKNGGLSSTVTVSSTVTGSLAFGAGVTGQASLGVVYAGGSLSMPHSEYFSVNPPYMTNTLQGSLSATVELHARQDFQLNYAGQGGLTSQ
jgi:hypothetical protein